MRTSTGKSRPQRLWISSITATVNRVRFSGLPPHLSVRRLEWGEWNWCSSQPWPAWTITMPKPRPLAYSAAEA